MLETFRHVLGKIVGDSGRRAPLSETVRRHIWKTHEAPSACMDCYDPERPESAPVPVLVSQTDKVLVHKCPKCGHLHYTGLPASVTHGKKSKGGD